MGVRRTPTAAVTRATSDGRAGLAPLAPILAAEDSDEDFTTLTWALAKLGVTRPLRRCTNADDVLDYVRQGGAYAAPGTAPHPALILLDLNLGADDGRELLTQLKGSDASRAIPVVVWTTSNRVADVDLCYARGASGYLHKPVDARRLLRSLGHVMAYWLETVLLPGATAGRHAAG